MLLLVSNLLRRLHVNQSSRVSSTPGTHGNTGNLPEFNRHSCSYHCALSNWFLMSVTVQTSLLRHLMKVSTLCRGPDFIHAVNIVCSLVRSCVVLIKLNQCRSLLELNVLYPCNLLGWICRTLHEIGWEDRLLNDL